MKTEILHNRDGNGNYLKGKLEKLIHFFEKKHIFLSFLEQTR